MQKILLLIFSAFLFFGSYAQKRKVLFNGENLKGWNITVKDTAAPPDEVFWVVDNVINAKGEPYGYLSTKRRYSNYKLHVEWRWVTKPTNSGVLVHAEGTEFWPNCIEAQLMAENAGDIVIVGIGTELTANDTIFKNEQTRYTVIPKYGESSEKSVGSWNEYDITCHKDNITIYVNGELKNEGTNCSRTKGYICLQSEGSHIQFRNIYIEKLKKK